MPKVVTIPQKLRPYVFHGVGLEEGGGDQAVGDCPFCGREGKFYVAVDTGLWQCKVCQAGSERGGGNVYTFLRELWRLSDEKTNGETSKLAADRKLLEAATLTHFGICVSITTGDWLAPGFSVDGKLNQLYKYSYDYVEKRMKFWPTPTLAHQMHGVDRFNKDKKDVYLLEGPWDMCAWWEMVRCAKWDDGKLVFSGEASSLLKDANVLAVPNCGAVGEPLRKFAPLFAGKRLFIGFDSDRPRESKNGGRPAEPAGFAATKRAVEILMSEAERPDEVHYIKWGEQGYDPSLPEGFDVRDALGAGGSTSERLPILQDLLSKMVQAPDAWFHRNGRPAAKKNGSYVSIDLLECTSWEDLLNDWRPAMKMTEGLNRALSVMCAVVISTPLSGDQLWVKVISPPSSGKSVLCEAVSTNRSLVFPKDTMTRLVSGYQVDKEGSENFSLAKSIKGKCLAIKDGDTIIQAPNRPQILAQIRALYDKNIRTSFGNAMSEDHEDQNTTILLCGTSSLRELDTSELGERFLDCVVVDHIDEDLEDSIGWRVANQADRDTRLVGGSEERGNEAPEMLRAKRRTGGYLQYLSDNLQELTVGVESSDDALRKCTTLAKFVAFMRARPSPKQEEKAEREMSFRLIKQLVRLAKCLAIVLNKRELDDEVMRRVVRCAMDTARGRTLELARHLHKAGAAGAELRALAMWTGQSEEKEKMLLRFLRKIGVTEPITKVAGKPGLTTRPRWKLTDNFSKLYAEVMSYGDS